MIEKLNLPDNVIISKPLEKDKPLSPCKQTEIEFQTGYFQLHLTLYHDHHMLQAKILNNVPNKKKRMYPLLSVNNKSRVVMDIVGKREQSPEDIQLLLTNIEEAKTIMFVFQTIIDKYYYHIQK